MGGAVCYYSVLPAEGSRDHFSEAAHATLETRQVLGTGGGGLCDPEQLTRLWLSPGELCTAGGGQDLKLEFKLL